jgi:hypothetical protein
MEIGRTLFFVVARPLIGFAIGKVCVFLDWPMWVGVSIALGAVVVTMVIEEQGQRMKNAVEVIVLFVCWLGLIGLGAVGTIAWFDFLCESGLPGGWQVALSVAAPILMLLLFGGAMTALDIIASRQWLGSRE